MSDWYEYDQEAGDNNRTRYQYCEECGRRMKVSSKTDRRERYRCDSCMSDWAQDVNEYIQGILE